MPEQDVVEDGAVESALRFNSKFYAGFYRNPFVGWRYETRYRANIAKKILVDAGVDIFSPDFRTFEYGFGNGDLLKAVCGASAVVGMEASPSAVERARSIAPLNHPHWEMIEWADCTHTRLDSESFDLVSAAHVLEHLPDDGAAITEWIRLLRPGGHLLLYLPSNEVLFKGSKHLRTYDVDEFSERLCTYGLERITVDENQRFDRPFKHRYLVLLSRANIVIRLLLDIPRMAAFLPAQLISWRILLALDSVLEKIGAKSSSIAYLFRKPNPTVQESGTASPSTGHMAQFKN